MVELQSAFIGCGLHEKRMSFASLVQCAQKRHRFVNGIAWLAWMTITSGVIWYTKCFSPGYWHLMKWLLFWTQVISTVDASILNLQTLYNDKKVTASDSFMTFCTLIYIYIYILLYTCCASFRPFVIDHEGGVTTRLKSSIRWYTLAFHLEKWLFQEIMREVLNIVTAESSVWVSVPISETAWTS